MSQAISSGIRLLRVAGHSTICLQTRTLACNKHSHVLTSLYCSVRKTHSLLPPMWTVLNESSMRLLCRELLQSSLLRSSFHTGSFYHVQKQERAVTSEQKDDSQTDGGTDRSSRLDVPHKVLELSDENNESLGSVPRDEAIQLSKDKKLKLVLINPNSRPYPTYRLMSQEDFDAEQSRIKENLKKKVKVREVRLACGIGEHDLEVKRRQMNKWFEDPKYETHVKVVVKGGKTWKPVTEEEQVRFSDGSIDSSLSSLRSGVFLLFCCWPNITPSMNHEPLPTSTFWLFNNL